MTVEEVVLKLTADIREFEREMWKAKNLVRGLFDPAVLFGAVGSSAGGPIGGVLGMGVGATVGVVTNVVKTVAGVVGTALKEVASFGYESIKWAAELGIEYERIGISFEVMVGSAERGRKLLERLNQTAVNSPFRSSQLLPTAEMLLGMGVDSGNVAAAVDRLGEIAAGSERKLMRLALAYGQVVAAGRLKGGELRQFIEAGIGIADFAQTAGVPVAQFQASVSAPGGGRFSTVRVVEETLNRLTSQGGRFGGLNQRLLGTVSGAYNQLIETFELTAKKAAEAVLQKLGVADRISRITEMTSGMDMKSVEAWADRAAKGLKPVLDLIETFVLNLVGNVGGSLSEMLPSWDKIGTMLHDLVTNGIPAATSAVTTFFSLFLTGLSGMLSAASSLLDTYAWFKGGGQSPELIEKRVRNLPENQEILKTLTPERRERVVKDTVERAMKFETYDPTNVKGNAAVAGVYALDLAVKGLGDLVKKLDGLSAEGIKKAFDPTAKELQKAAVGAAFGGLGVVGAQAPKNPVRPEIRNLTPAAMQAGALGGGLGVLAFEDAKLQADMMKERLSAYAEAEQRVAKYQEKRYAPAMYSGSADAQDTINKAVGAAQDKQQEVIQVIQESNRLLELEQKEAEETNRILRDLEKKGIVLKGKGI